MTGVYCFVLPASLCVYLSVSLCTFVSLSLFLSLCISVSLSFPLSLPLLWCKTSLFTSKRKTYDVLYYLSNEKYFFSRNTSLYLEVRYPLSPGCLKNAMFYLMGINDSLSLKQNVETLLEK